MPEALDAYQKSLESNPNSIEAKQNIELLVAAGEGEGEGDGDDKKPQDGKDKKDQKDQKDQKPKDGEGPKPPEPPKGPQGKPTPKPFKSDNLSQQDVGRILEELKQQEDKIREKMQREGAKEAPRDKDW